MSRIGKVVLRAEVSEDLCVGVGMCTHVAPGAFKRNPEGQSEFREEGEWTAEALREAAESCPMAAITIIETDVEDS